MCRSLSITRNLVLGIMRVLGAVVLVLLVVCVPVSSQQYPQTKDNPQKKSNQWDGYIDQLIAQGNGYIDGVCIFSLEDGRVLNSPDHDHALHMSQQEIGRLFAGYVDGRWFTLERLGLFVQGKKYIFVSHDRSGIIKGVRFGSEAGGILGETSKTAVVIVHTSSPSSIVLVQANVVMGEVVANMKSHDL